MADKITLNEYRLLRYLEVMEYPKCQISLNIQQALILDKALLFYKSVNDAALQEMTPKTQSKRQQALNDIGELQSLLAFTHTLDEARTEPEYITFDDEEDYYQDE